MDNFQNEIQNVQMMLKAKRRLSASEKLEKLVNELKPEEKQEHNLFEALVILADLLNSMDYLSDSLSRRNEAISLAIKLFGVKHIKTIDQLLARAHTTWTLLDKQEERQMILKYARETASSIGDVNKLLNMTCNYPNREAIIEDLRQKLACALMIINANMQIDRMINEKKAQKVEDEDMLDEPYPI